MLTTDFDSWANSTLLSVMFGGSSSSIASGVALQLVPCPGRNGYDYLLLLDTMNSRHAHTA